MFLTILLTTLPNIFLASDITHQLRRVGRLWDEEVFRIVDRALGGLNVFRYMLKKEGNMDKIGSWIAYISSILVALS